MLIFICVALLTRTWFYVVFLAVFWTSVSVKFIPLGVLRPLNEMHIHQQNH